MAQAGIDNDVTVVGYDDEGGAFASRFWWMLNYLGHKKAYVLDGGYSAWKKAGYPTTSEQVGYKRRDFTVGLQHDKLCSYKDVVQEAAKATVQLIDSRERPRYLGLRNRSIG